MLLLPTLTPFHALFGESIAIVSCFQVNRLSYYAVDGFFWTMGMKSHTAAFRESIGLPALSQFEFGIELTKGVPFGYLWSESLVPTPDDWGPHIDVCGTVITLR